MNTKASARGGGGGGGGGGEPERTDSISEQLSILYPKLPVVCLLPSQEQSKFNRGRV